MTTLTGAKRYTVFQWLVMVLASGVALAIGFLGFGLYLPNLMTFAQVLDSADRDVLGVTIFLFLSAGPVAAGAGLVLGWIAFFARAPRLGVRLAFWLPASWALMLLAYLGLVLGACEGDFTCGL